MDLDRTIQRAQQVIDLAIKAEVHAFILVGSGVAMVLHGQKDVGTGLVMTGLGIFKGNRQ